jgi:hypothetical protein
VSNITSLFWVEIGCHRHKPLVTPDGTSLFGATEYYVSLFDRRGEREILWDGGLYAAAMMFANDYAWEFGCPVLDATPEALRHVN